MRHAVCVCVCVLWLPQQGCRRRRAPPAPPSKHSSILNQKWDKTSGRATKLGGRKRMSLCVCEWERACRRKTLRSLCLQTDIVNFVNFVNILMMTSLVRAKKRGRREGRESKSCFLVWPKCNLHVNQISSFVAWPSPGQRRLPTRSRSSRELQSCHKWQLAKRDVPPTPPLHCAISPKALNRNYVDEAVGVSALTV